MFAVAEDGVPRHVALGGAGILEQGPVLTLYLPRDWGWQTGRDLSVNLLSGARWLRSRNGAAVDSPADFHYELSESIAPARIAEARLAFECRVVATGTLAGLDGHGYLVVAQVLSAHQRWPRGCAIT